MFSESHIRIFGRPSGAGLVAEENVASYVNDMEKLSKLVVGKNKWGDFKAQRLLFWERCWKQINRVLVECFETHWVMMNL